jgi:S-adenosylmethionine-diacylglycerol 3-amino-3-carboxypropyl transferase
MFNIDPWLEFGFQNVHKNNLVYVTCWEDPRLDRKAMDLTEDDTVVVLTSAGCNAIEYALDSPKQVHAVDVNPRQNALLELKIAGIKGLDYDRFFQLFGEGQLADFEQQYQDNLRHHLSPFAQQYWDQFGSKYFTRGRSLFFHGTTGIFAQLINFYIDHIVRVRDEINELLAAKTLEQQNQVYYDKLNERFWSRPIHQLMNSDITLWMLGVPYQQRRQMERYLKGGVADFIQDCCRQVFTQVPIRDNYFWRVFIDGKYNPNCCPEYLKQENFQRLKDGLIDRVLVHTNTITGFLEQEQVEISRFVLLDHMDWLSNYKYAELKREWQAIVDRAKPQSRILFRSGGFKVDYVDPIQVSVQGQSKRLGDLLQYKNKQAQDLHQKDRVHTYGSFYIADLVTA